MSLIEQRHPKLGQLLRVWRAHCDGESLPSVGLLTRETPAELAPSTVLLTRDDGGADGLRIAASGAEVDALPAARRSRVGIADHKGGAHLSPARDRCAQRRQRADQPGEHG